VLVAAAAVGVVVALIVGLSTLRLSGIYFVIFSFGLAELVRQLVHLVRGEHSRLGRRYIFADTTSEGIYWRLLVLTPGARRRMADPASRASDFGARDRPGRDRGAPLRHRHHRAKLALSRSAPPS